MRSPAGRRATGAQGFTLVELLVGITILLIVVVAFVPLLVHIAEGTQAGKARLVATKLASSEIERIRSLSYHQIGNVGGNPPGNIQRERTETLNGITYTIITNVSWWDDPSDDVGGRDPIPYDYKRVRVSVSAASVFSGAVTRVMDIDTLAALEGEEEAFPGGNIRAWVQRGWKTGTEEIPIGNVRVDLTDGPDAPQSLWTDEFGRALFAILREGDYTVQANAAGLGMMVHPGQAEQNTGVTLGVTSELVFEVEHPCYLSLRLVDRQSGAAVSASGRVVLVRFDGVSESRQFTSDAAGRIGTGVLGPLWPVGGVGGTGYPGVYGLRIEEVPGYSNYDMSVHEKPLKPDGTPWDGRFGAPGETLELTVRLHGPFYQEPGMVPFTTAREFDRLAVTAPDGYLILGAGNVSAHEFEVVRYASAMSNGEMRYRGYRFRVRERRTVTHLIGGGSAGGFAVALYRAAANTNTPAALLGEVRFTAGGRQVAALPQPVVLEPAEDYIIAQGRVTGSGSHRRVTQIRVAELLTDQAQFSSWFPENGNAIAWNVTGDPTVIVNRSPNSTNNTNRPDLGFVYQTTGYQWAGRRTSQPVDLSLFTSAPVLRIWWEAEVPPGTSLTVATAVTGSTATPPDHAFVTVTNGGAVPGIVEGADLRGWYLWIRQSLGTTDMRQTPVLRRLEVGL
ncbi:MAG: type II secretion system protein [Bacillota bacterium]